MRSIQLRVIDKTTGGLNGQSIVLFQKNLVDEGYDEVIAWKVMLVFNSDDDQFLRFHDEEEIDSMDSWGNMVGQRLPVAYGSLYRLYNQGRDCQLSCIEGETLPGTFAFRNDLALGSVSCNIYRDGRLIAKKHPVIPCQTVYLKFDMTFWMGIVNGVTEGSVLNSAMIANMNTNFDLMNIESADILIRDSKQSGRPVMYEFAMDNITYKK